jgi:hypothetical protein
MSVCASGEEYRGEYRNDVKCGWGEWKSREGVKYEGSFLSDNPHGNFVKSYAGNEIQKGKKMYRIERCIVRLISTVRR